MDFKNTEKYLTFPKHVLSITNIVTGARFGFNVQNTNNIIKNQIEL